MQRLDEAKELLAAAEKIADRVYGAAHDLTRNVRTVQQGVKTMEQVIDKVPACTCR